MSNYPATQYVRTLQQKGSKYGLERERELLNRLGSPDNKLKIVHVAGTNGKGSVCAYITSVLIAAGKSVGTFTSPAVFSYEEQFMVNGVKSADLTEEYLAKTLCAAQGMEDKPTSFELETAAALLMFCGEGCEYAVVECGLGGLCDSTNAIAKKEVAVINSISLEHTAILGDTVLKIAEQKAGIIKNCPAVINGLQPPEVLRYLRDIGGVIADDVQILTEDINGCKFLCGGKEYEISMHGNVQPYNAAVAIKVCKLLGIQDEFIAQGLIKATLAGRIQIINSVKTYILDGAHNPSGFVPLADYLKKYYSDADITIIYGCLSDKDICGCLQHLSGVNAKVIAVSPPSYRAKPCGEIYGECKKFFTDVTAAQSVSAALSAAKSGVVVVCGSFTVLKEAEEWIGKRQ
ncbi:MAG: bifunctional folylpolyglutamate synthase/dihydrofolate synthase [Clostridia bacterium]|nr:bifunctional folylpolyglutamate synthase/dihydrofolate synthase [Clostridia bacterium]